MEQYLGQRCDKGHVLVWDVTLRNWVHLNRNEESEHASAQMSKS